MYIGISRNTRRVLLKTVLTNFLNEKPPADAPKEAVELYATLAAEARMTLREIDATERLASNLPPSHSSDTTTHSNTRVIE